MTKNATRNAATPGPWQVTGESGRYFVEGGVHGPLCSIRYLGNAASAIAEEDANARLMAAAPELLTIVQQVAGEGRLLSTSEYAEARALLARIAGDAS